MKEIEVFSQEELNALPIDFNGRIIIKFGTPYNRAVINRRFKYPVVARENSSVEARGNSSVVAWENSSVGGKGNSQICDKTYSHKITVMNNSRIVYEPKTIYEYLDYYDLEHADNMAKLYKAVHKREARYFSDNDSTFEYVIGETKEAERVDMNTTEDCGEGIHMAYLDWCLRYGECWSDLAILEVETSIAGLVLPDNNPGKVRAKEVKVLREVPLEECGIYGKMLAKRRAAT